MLTLLTLLAPAPQIPALGAQEAFAAYEEAALADGGALWERDLAGPMLFADPRTRAVVANQPDEHGRLSEREGVFVGTLPLEVGIANTATEWAGVRWTMVQWPLPTDPYGRATLLLHEAFHRVQPSLPHAGGSELSPHLEREEGRLWLRLELRALARALRARDAAQRTAIGEALTFRAHRQALFAPARALEAAVERNEGLAEYTGLRLCGASSEVRLERAAQKLLRDEQADSFVRSFAYATGPAYGLLLDLYADGWRRAVGKETELATLLAGALAWNAPIDLAAAAEAASASYDGEALRTAERERARKFAARAAEITARYRNGPVLELTLSDGMNYTYDPNDILTLEGVGTFYGTLSITEGWGVLSAAGGALVERDEAGRMRVVRVPVEADAQAPRSGPGWTLALAPQWSLVPGARAGDWTARRP